MYNEVIVKLHNQSIPGGSGGKESAEDERVKSYLYLPFSTERNAIDDTTLSNEKEIFVPFVWRLPSIIFYKISVILSDRKWIFKPNASSCWQSVPSKMASINDPLVKSIV
uniref:Uncharacterized protein n=1 Tax=Romanomermis culicivorax TaxID=13658 RepID=A0A915IJH8_ROMCU